MSTDLAERLARQKSYDDTYWFAWRLRQSDTLEPSNRKVISETDMAVLRTIIGKALRCEARRVGEAAESSTRESEPARLAKTVTPDSRA